MAYYNSKFNDSDLPQEILELRNDFEFDTYNLKFSNDFWFALRDEPRKEYFEKNF